MSLWRNERAEVEGGVAGTATPSTATAIHGPVAQYRVIRPATTSTSGGPSAPTRNTSATAPVGSISGMPTASSTMLAQMTTKAAPRAQASVSLAVVRPAPLISTCLLLACSGNASIEQPPVVATPSSPAPPPAPPDPPAQRRCGEAGPTPTALPPALADGLPSLGKATLRPGESYRLGVVTVRYDISSEPALVMELAETEADGGPWSLQLPLRPQSSVRLPLGPYRVDARADAGTPPARLEIELFREVCPEAAAIADVPASLWVSTDGIRVHTHDLLGDPFTVAITVEEQRPQVEVKVHGYRHAFDPVPGTTASVRTGRHIVTLDEIAPGPGTRFAGAWSADRLPRAHARLRIEAAPPIVPAAPGQARPCGAPSDGRSLPPAEFATAPVAAGELHLIDGKRTRLGPLELEVVKHDLNGDDTRRGLNFRTVQRHNGPALRPEPLLVGFESTHWTRSGHDLLLIDENETRPPLHVRRFALICPAELAMPTLPTAPFHVWLSTHGLVSVTIGEATRSGLTLELTSDVRSPGLMLYSRQARLLTAIDPELVGTAYTLDGWSVDVIDVQASGDAHHEPNEWLTTAPVPPLHVQLRISPS